MNCFDCEFQIIRGPIFTILRYEPRYSSEITPLYFPPLYLGITPLVSDIVVKGATSRYFELFLAPLKMVVNWKETGFKQVIVCQGRETPKG